MKKVILAIGVLLLTTVGSYAQIENGNWLIGGNGNFSLSAVDRSGTIATNQLGGDVKDVDEIIFNLSPNVGYFFRDGFALGLNADFRHTEVSDLVTQTTTDANNPNSLRLVTINNTYFTAGPFAKYYYKLNDRAAVFGYVDLGLGAGSAKKVLAAGEGPQNTTVSLLNTKIGPGFAFFLNDYIGLEAGAFYRYGQQTYEADITTGGVTTAQKLLENTSGFELRLGFQIFLNKGGNLNTGTSKATY